jgi:hypothetical protein
MKVKINLKGCSIPAQQAIYNRGYKYEEYMNGDKRVLALVNMRTGDRIINYPNEKTFEDMCKRLNWL